MSTGPVRFGVIGAGAIAQLAHLPVLAKMRGAELVALCDNDGPKARALADRFGVPDAFTDIDELLEFDELDAVIVATPNHLHEPHVLSALAAGLDVLCERPVAVTAKGVDRILNAATKAGRKVVVANNHRFRSDVQALDRFLRGGELGKLQACAPLVPAARLDRGVAPAPRRGGWRVLLDHGLMLIDLAFWLLDFPAVARVTAHMERGRGAKRSTRRCSSRSARGRPSLTGTSTAPTSARGAVWVRGAAARGSARLAPLRVVKELTGGRSTYRRAGRRRATARSCSRTAPSSRTS